jgi:hypothetical protein
LASTVFEMIFFFGAEFGFGVDKIVEKAATTRIDYL